MYLKPKEIDSMNQEYKCSKCQVPCERPVRCKGPCHNLFCLQCAAEIKCESDRCPSKNCSSPFQVKPMVARLICPFNPEECTVPIQSQKNLATHYLICPFLQTKQRKLIDRKQNYKCKKGHNLTFPSKEALLILYGKYWFESTHIECASCEKVTFCRSICLICSTKEDYQAYCHMCRVPPVSKTQCPLGHILKQKKNPGKHQYCDLCEAPVSLMSREKVFGFCQCDFDLCLVCHSRLPQYNNKIPLKLDLKKINILSAVKEDKKTRNRTKK